MSDIQQITLAVYRHAMKTYITNGAYKTEATYQRQAWRSIRELYNSEIDEFAFIDDFVGYIDNQFGRAWRAGARDVGINPNQFTDDDQSAFNAIVLAEREFILSLAEDIVNARMNNASIEQFRQRADMWANRYNDVVNQARVHFGGRQYLEWVVGPTEHCETCATLNGIVATADEWAASGWRPQGRELECGGWRCQCSLVLTDKAPTEGGIPI